MTSHGLGDLHPVAPGPVYADPPCGVAVTGLTMLPPHVCRHPHPNTLCSFAAAQITIPSQTMGWLYHVPFTLAPLMCIH